jgi:hypothetical protein
VTIDVLWKKYLLMPEAKTLKKGTNDPMVAHKKQLVEIVEDLERDNLVMYVPEDGAVIMV